MTRLSTRTASRSILVKVELKNIIERGDTMHLKTSPIGPMHKAH